MVSESFYASPLQDTAHLFRVRTQLLSNLLLSCFVLWWTYHLLWVFASLPLGETNNWLFFSLTWEPTTGLHNHAALLSNFSFQPLPSTRVLVNWRVRREKKHPSSSPPAMPTYKAGLTGMLSTCTPQCCWLAARSVSSKHLHLSPFADLHHHKSGKTRQLKAFWHKRYITIVKILKHQNFQGKTLENKW